MAFTFDWQSIVQVTTFIQVIQKRYPGFFPLLAFPESFCVTNHYKRIASSGNQNVESLGRSHKSNVTGRVATRKRHDDDFALFPLVVVCYRQQKYIISIGERGGLSPIVDNRMGRLVC